MAQGAHIIPVIGARWRDQLTGALGALNVKLSADGLAEIEQTLPKGGAAGERYALPHMGGLNSQRGRTGLYCSLSATAGR
jgi:hypothetical protein